MFVVRVKTKGEKALERERGTKKWEKVGSLYPEYDCGRYSRGVSPTAENG